MVFNQLPRTQSVNMLKALVFISQEPGCRMLTPKILVQGGGTSFAYSQISQHTQINNI